MTVTVLLYPNRRDRIWTAIFLFHRINRAMRCTAIASSRASSGVIRGREGAGRAEGRILRVLGRAHPTVVGLFRYGPRGNVVLPYEARLHQEMVIPPGEELTPELLDKHERRLPNRHGEALSGTRWRRGQCRAHALSAAGVPARDA